MSVMTLDLTAVSSRRPPKWRKLLAELRQRARSRYELRILADREIWDLGPTRTDASYEAYKPFRHG
jgi:uncharacterized protein YjiS (DUF1127 family)